MKRLLFGATRERLGRPWKPNGDGFQLGGCIPRRAKPNAPSPPASRAVVDYRSQRVGLRTKASSFSLNRRNGVSRRSGLQVVAA